jgi:parallel beta-helix repeat protein
MKTSKLFLFAAATVFVVLTPACKDDESSPTSRKYTITPADYSDAAVQEALINMNDGDTVYFQQGTYSFASMLSIDDKENIVVMGDSMSNTILSFSGQVNGAQSIIGTNLTFVLFRDFTIKDPEGDGIKVKDSDGITFLRVGVTHTNPGLSTNGGYGLYPVTSQNVLIDDCYVTGASDAGIYVGQSQQVIVRNSLVEGNVAGIEIENCINADVFGNTARHNTGGILIFDLPNLPVIKNGHTCRVFSNTIESNDHRNFAPSGNIVASVPVGTGIMMLAAKTVEVFNNTLTENNVMGIGIVAYNTLAVVGGEGPPSDTLYVTQSKEINIHNNTITSSTDYPDDMNDLADFLVANIFQGGDVPDILYDGFVHPDYAADSTKGVCIKNNSGDFANINVPGLFMNISTDASPHDCSPASLPQVTVVAPTNP